MKGNKELITELNKILSDELKTINQNILHSEICENRGYRKLHLALRNQAIEQMHHAQWLIEHIIFFEGAPMVSRLNPIKIGINGSEVFASSGENHSINYSIRQSYPPFKLFVRLILNCLPNYLKWKTAMLIGTKYNVQKLTKWNWKMIWLHKLKVSLADAN